MTTEDFDAIPTHLAEVRRVRQLSPGVRRVTVGGGLDRLVSKGPDSFVYVLVAPPWCDELAIGTDFSWLGYYELGDDVRPVGAYYTIRNHRPEVGEIDLDMVLHDPVLHDTVLHDTVLHDTVLHDPAAHRDGPDGGDEAARVPGPGEGGHAAAFARRAAPGDAVALWGPRTAYEPPDDTQHFVLVADDTGLPATCAIVESLSAEQSATVFVEVADAGERQPLESAADLDVTWLYRDGTPPGGTDVLGEMVRKLEPPDRPAYVWGGGESRILTAIRKHVRREWGLPRERVSLTPYWRHASSPEPEPDDD